MGVDVASKRHMTAEMELQEEAINGELQVLLQDMLAVGIAETCGPDYASLVSHKKHGLLARQETQGKVRTGDFQARCARQIFQRLHGEQVAAVTRRALGGAVEPNFNASIRSDNGESALSIETTSDFGVKRARYYSTPEELARYAGCLWKTDSSQRHRDSFARRCSRHYSRCTSATRRDHSLLHASAAEASANDGSAAVQAMWSLLR